MKIHIKDTVFNECIAAINHKAKIHKKCMQCKEKCKQPEYMKISVCPAYKPKKQKPL